MFLVGVPGVGHHMFYSIMDKALSRNNISSAKILLEGGKPKDAPDLHNYLTHIWNIDLERPVYPKKDLEEIINKMNDKTHFFFTASFPYGHPHRKFNRRPDIKEMFSLIGNLCDIKIIVLYRNPISSTWSALRRKFTDNINMQMRMIENNWIFINDQIQQIPRKSFKILRYENFFENFQRSIKIISDFWKINKNDFKNTLVEPAEIPKDKEEEIKNFFTEELWNRRERGVYDMCQGYDRALELYKANTKLKGTENVRWCPIGYSPAFELKSPVEIEEDIDILFFGSKTERRKNFEKDIKKHLKGKVIIFRDGLFGEERDKLILRSKIVTNVKAHDMWSYGPLHCLLSQCKKKMTFSEKANGGYGPFIPNKHFIEYNSVEDFVKKAKKYLENEEERKDFAKRAYKEIKKNCKFTKYLKNALEDYL
jgi:hypothetical protein